MTGFAVYSTTAEPDCLYATGNTDAIDATTTAEMVWTGNRPLDMVVDLADRRVWWAFEADRETKTTRTGHFVAAYDGGEDLFEGFAEALRSLHESDEWAVPHTGDVRSDAGFELWRVSPDIDSADTAAFETLVDRLSDGHEHRGSTVTAGMNSYTDALVALRALDAAGVDCTVGVDSGDDVFHFQHVDAMLVPTGAENFTLRGVDVVNADNGQVAEDSSETASSLDDTVGQRSRGSDFSAGGVAARLAGVVLVGLIGFATYSFFTRQPVHPISGLATFGAFFGTIGAINVWYATAANTGNQSTVARRSVDAGQVLRRPFRADGDRPILVLMGGTLAGFVFPRVVWEAGVLVGRDGYLFGLLSGIAGAIPAVMMYIVGLFVVTVAVARLGSQYGRWQPIRGVAFLRVAVGFITYGVCLFLATGLAETVWYGFIPAI